MSKNKKQLVADINHQAFLAECDALRVALIATAQSPSALLRPRLANTALRLIGRTMVLLAEQRRNGTFVPQSQQDQLQALQRAAVLCQCARRSYDFTGDQ